VGDTLAYDDDVMKEDCRLYPEDVLEVRWVLLQDHVSEVVFICWITEW